MAKILFLSGSTRKGSINQKLALLAANMAEQSGADVSIINLIDFEMPLYNSDLEKEKGLPENAKKLKKIFIEHDGFFIASPEYNGFFTPLIKNTIDWLSRPNEDNEAPLIAYKGKIAALGAVSPGRLGGLRGLVPLRLLLGNIGVTVLPSQIAIDSGFQAFDEAGNLIDQQETKRLQVMLNEFIRTIDCLIGKC